MINRRKAVQMLLGGGAGMLCVPEIFRLRSGAEDISDEERISTVSFGASTPVPLLEIGYTERRYSRGPLKGMFVLIAPVTVQFTILGDIAIERGENIDAIIAWSDGTKDTFRGTMYRENSLGNSVDGKPLHRIAMIPMVQ